jgi:hypothetical protein
VIGIRLRPITLRELRGDKYATPFLSTLLRTPALAEREQVLSDIGIR